MSESKVRYRTSDLALEGRHRVIVLYYRRKVSLSLNKRSLIQICPFPLTFMIITSAKLGQIFDR